MLEHFHANHGIVVTGVTGRAQLSNRREAHIRCCTEPPATIGQLFDVDIRAGCFAEESACERDKCAVATTVVEQRAAGTGRREFTREFEPAAMTPLDERVLAEELLPGVVPLLEQLRGAGHT